MRKILVLSLVLSLLGSCSFWNKGTDFTSLYSAYVSAQVEGLEDISEMLGYKRQESINGAIKAALQVPVLMSGAFSSDYDMKMNNTDMSALFENVKMNFESPINSGAITAKKIGFTSITGDLFILMEDFADVGLFPPEAQAVFSKYNNKWLSYTQEDIDATLSGASADEIMLSNTAKNLSKMGLSDIEKYLLEYPVWTSTADLGMSGSLHAFAVELDREAIVSLIKDVTLDITGSGITSEDETNLRTSMESLSLSGTIAFDPDNAHVMTSDLSIAVSGVLVGKIVSSNLESKSDFKLTSIPDATDVIVSLVHEKDRDDMKITLTQSGAELAQITGYILRDGTSIREISLDATTQGVSLTMKHTSKEDGTFEGRMTLPVGTITWTGKVLGKKLDALTLKGTTPMGSIDMSLAPAGEMLRGPLVVKNGSDEILSADIGLRVDDGIFGLELAVQNPEGGDPTLKTSFEITHESEKFDDRILAPSPSEPLQNLIDDLEKIAPVETEEDIFGEDMSLEELEPIEDIDIETPPIDDIQ